MNRMYRMVWALVMVGVLAVPVGGWAGGSSESRCDTRYPIVLAHGMGFSAEVLGIVDYWYGIVDALEDEGAKVYVTSVNGMDSTEAKALDFKDQFEEILAESNAEKLNIIGHSHGTLYTRYAISNLGIGSYVASHTSLCGPHQGSSIADMLIGFDESLNGLASDALDFLYAFVFGDTNPDTLQNGYDLTTSYMSGTFNPNTPDHEDVYYQSWASKVKVYPPMLLLEPTWLILLNKEGANDGLVSVESAKWGTFRGTKSGSLVSPGVDHAGMINHLFGITPGFYPKEFYVNVVEELKENGF